MIFVWVVPVLLGAAAAIGRRHYLSESIAEQAARQSSMAPAHFAAINVDLPSGAVAFPHGDGADIANANCLICHSAGMVLRQLPLTVAYFLILRFHLRLPIATGLLRPSLAGRYRQVLSQLWSLFFRQQDMSSLSKGPIIAPRAERPWFIIDKRSPVEASAPSSNR